MNVSSSQEHHDSQAPSLTTDGRVVVVLTGVSPYKGVSPSQ